eukprot:SAG31_NODE_5049_length_2776_cov_8.966754_1_plen_141_part_00
MVSAALYGRRRFAAGLARQRQRADRAASGSARATASAQLRAPSVLSAASISRPDSADSFGAWIADTLTAAQVGGLRTDSGTECEAAAQSEGSTPTGVGRSWASHTVTKTERLRCLDALRGIAIAVMVRRPGLKFRTPNPL